MNKTLKLVLLAVLSMVFIFCGYWLYLFTKFTSVTNSQQKKWLNEVFIPLTIKGVIYELDKDNPQKCFSNLIVDTGKDEGFSCGVCICNDNKPFIDYALAGDSLIKVEGSTKVTIKKTSGESKDFDFPFCNN